MNKEQADAAQRLMYKPQKEIILEKLKFLSEATIDDIKIDYVQPLGWTAVIRTDDLDIVFTYYGLNCWKMETFPVYSMSGATLKSVNPKLERRK